MSDLDVPLDPIPLAPTSLASLPTATDAWYNDQHHPSAPSYHPRSASDIVDACDIPRVDSPRIKAPPAHRRWPPDIHDRISAQHSFTLQQHGAFSRVAMAGSSSDLSPWQIRVRYFIQTDLTAVLPFLSDEDRFTLADALPWFAPSHHFPPSNPMPRRLYGCGRDNPDTSTRHSSPSGFLLIHFAWSYLSDYERYRLGVDISPIFRMYGRLRMRALTLDLAPLWQDRPSPCKAPIDPLMVQRFAACLLRYNFNYGDFIRAFGGRYTYEGRDWDSRWDIIDSIADIDPPEDYPPVDSNRAFRVLTMGVPLAGHFCCDFAAASARNLYNNHSTIRNDSDVHNLVREKFRKESELSYSIVFPRWLWRFIAGIFIIPLTFVMPKHATDDGRICHDASNPVPAPEGSDPLFVDNGAPNAQTPAPGTPDRIDENPPIFYGTALHRLLKWIWNLRIDFPTKDILVIPDDISAAFHRCFYNPNMMPLHASVLDEYLAIPTGVIFGGKASASYYMDVGELRAHVANAFNFGPASTALTDRLRLEASPDAATRATFSTAPRDALNPGAEALRSHGRFGALHSSFVDDSGNADIASRIVKTIVQSVLAAYVLFGFPGSDHWAQRPPIINAEKWIEFVTYCCTFLGFFIDTRAMTISWPQLKRGRLATLLDQLVTEYTAGRPISCRLVARILGLLRNGCQVAPLGSFLSIRLQHCLNSLISAAAGKGSFSSPNRIRRWWSRAFIRPDRESVNDLRWLRSILEPEKQESRFWTRPIGLLVPRTIQGLWYSDASYEGIGGWCRYFRVMWRITKSDLEALEFPIPLGTEWDPESNPEHALHINILELVGLIVNLWFTITLCLKSDPTAARHHIFHFKADNTSALSWFRKATKSRTPVVRRLARFVQALLTFSPVPLQISQDHIPGPLNGPADVLSRPLTKCPSWASAIAVHPTELGFCQAYQVPHALLLLLQNIIVCPSTADLHEQRMMQLLTLTPKILPDGWQTSATMTSLLPASRRGKASR